MKTGESLSRLDKSFLKIGIDFFAGTYETEDGKERSFYTLHLYLNDSASTHNPVPEEEHANPKSDQETACCPDGAVIGGATSFLSRDLKRRIDVEPKIGRVLIFQQKGLLHCGDEVTAGTKFTMRTDLMYEFQLDDDNDGEIVFG